MIFKKLFDFGRRKKKIHDEKMRKEILARLKELEREYKKAEKEGDAHKADKCRREMAECRIQNGLLE